jgi:thiol:disulfide interchange protein
VLVAASIAVAVFPREGNAPSPSADREWQPYSAHAVAALTAAGKPVFVDFTAAWCVTCQVNKKLVLSRDEMVDAFRARGVQLVRADWTRRDPAIAQALASIGRSGVPAYVLYKPGRAPLVLPEILTRERVIEALDR